MRQTTLSVVRTAARRATECASAPAASDGVWAAHPVVVVQQVSLRCVERVERQSRLWRRVLVGVHPQGALAERAAERADVAKRRVRARAGAAAGVSARRVAWPLEPSGEWRGRRCGADAPVGHVPLRPAQRVQRHRRQAQAGGVVAALVRGDDDSRLRRVRTLLLLRLLGAGCRGRPPRRRRRLGLLAGEGLREQAVQVARHAAPTAAGPRARNATSAATSEARSRRCDVTRDEAQ